MGPPARSVLGLLLGLILLLTAPVQGEDSASPGGARAQLADSIDVAATILREVLQGVHEIHVDPPSTQTLLEAALEGMRQHLDAHTRVLTTEQFDGLKSRGSGTVGIGISLSFTEAFPRIQRVWPGTPAAEGGLLPGDRLLSANDHALEGLSEDGVRRELRGMIGTCVELRIASPGSPPRTVELRRRRVLRPALEERLIADGRFGYLGIRRFGRGCASEAEAVLVGWAERSLSGLILDLRGNPGGFLDEAAEIADLLLPVGAGIVRTRGRLEEENGVLWSAREPILPGTPVVVLVDSLTASSAEVLAGALKGTAGVRVAGQPTYGKRSVQRVRPLSCGGALKVTASYFSLPGDPEFGVASTAQGAGRFDPVAGIDAWAPPAELSSISGRRLRCDRPLDPERLPEPWSWIEDHGLLGRFLEQWTLTEEDQRGCPWWSGPSPLSATGGEQRPQLAWTEGASGFGIWCDRLGEALATWGVVIDLPSNPDPRGGPLPPALARAWLADWVAERWGEEAGFLARLELDPWIIEAIRELEHLGAASGQAAVHPR